MDRTGLGSQAGLLRILTALSSGDFEAHSALA